MLQSLQGVSIHVKSFDDALNEDDDSDSERGPVSYLHKIITICSNMHKKQPCLFQDIFWPMCTMCYNLSQACETQLIW